MSESRDDRQLVLSAAEVRRWKAECGEIERKIEELHRQKDALEKKLEAATLLAPSLLEIDFELSDKSVTRNLIRNRKGRATWTSLIEEEVRASREGIRQRDLLENMRKSIFGERFSSSDSSFYNAVQKLLRRKVLVKRGEYLFTPAQHEEYVQRVERGEVVDVAQASVYGSAAGAEVVRCVKQHPGIRSIDIIRHIWALNDGEQLPSKTSLYNTISRLVDQKHIRKEDGNYFPCDEKETPSVDAEGVSKADDEGDASSSCGAEKVTGLFDR